MAPLGHAQSKNFGGDAAGPSGDIPGLPPGVTMADYLHFGRLIGDSPEEVAAVVSAENPSLGFDERAEAYLAE